MKLCMRGFNTMPYLQEHVFAIRIGLSIRSGAESNDTFQRALLLYEGGMRQSLHTEKQAKSYRFKMCSVTMDGCRR
jgi:hypothetical protein